MGKLLRFGLGVVTLVVGLAIAVAGLIVVLPPFFGSAVWMASVIFGEWSLLLILPAIVVLLLAWFSRWAGLRRTALVAVILAGVTFVLAAIPAVRGGVAMSARGVRFDPLGYLAGSVGDRFRDPLTTETYAEPDGTPLRVDVWRTPERTDRPRPAVVFVHGGSWVEGRRSEAARWDAWFDEHLGYVAFDIDYRLAAPGRPTWNRAPGDVKCAISWVRANAERYNVDPNRIVLMGESAGGHLAMLAAYSDDRFPSSCPGEGGSDGEPRTDVAAVIALYAPSELVKGYRARRPWWYNAGMWETAQRWQRDFLGGDPRQAPEAYRLSEPFRHVTPESPPTLLVHGGEDKIVPLADSRRMARVLQQNNVDHELVEIGYADHMYDLNWGGFGTQITRAEIERFLR